MMMIIIIQQQQKTIRTVASLSVNKLKPLFRNLPKTNEGKTWELVYFILFYSCCCCSSPGNDEWRLFMQMCAIIALPRQSPSPLLCYLGSWCCWCCLCPFIVSVIQFT